MTRSRELSAVGERLCPICDSRLVLLTAEGPLGDFSQWWECRFHGERE